MSPAPGTVVRTATSGLRYKLTGSNGRTWFTIDASKLALTLKPAVDTNALLTGSADLSTSSPGSAQDIGISVSGGGYHGIQTWKEEGGSGRALAPAAASLQTVVPLAEGTTYTIALQWKAGKPGPGTIWAGAGPNGGTYSPTRLVAELVPAAGSTTVFTAAGDQQHSLGASDGTTWWDMDFRASPLSFSVTPASSCLAVVSASAELWTSAAGFNQDLAIRVSGGSYGDGQIQPWSGGGTLLTWKESSGGVAYSRNTVLLQAAVPLQAGITYTFKLQWKAGKNQPWPGFIYAGAGPLDGHFALTQIIAKLVPEPSATAIATSAITRLYKLPGSASASWTSMDTSKLRLRLTPSADVNAILSGNADLSTSNPGYSQDIGLMVAGGKYGSGQVVGWKETSEAAGLSPNAAFVLEVVPLQARRFYTITLVWRASRAGPGAIWSGAGPLGGSYSPTEIAAELASSA